MYCTFSTSIKYLFTTNVKTVILPNDSIHLDTANMKNVYSLQSILLQKFTENY